MRDPRKWQASLTDNPHASKWNAVTTTMPMPEPGPGGAVAKSAATI